MRVIVIGGTGHIGTYLVPRLVRAGHEVVCISRQQREPYHSDRAWERVEHLGMDRKAMEADGDFGAALADLGGDVVMDMICYTAAGVRQVVEAIRQQCQHYIFCGTMWVHGHSSVLPATEDLPRNPICEYGRNKAEAEAYLLGETRLGGLACTVLHPGHISGPGWVPINPAGNIDLDVYRSLACGEEVLLPHLGMETLHHVHADDVAQAFMGAMNHWSRAAGESFHVVSPGAVTLRGYAEAVASWFGREANLRFLPWEEFRQAVGETNAGHTWNHIAHSPNGSIAKARSLLGYQPRYTSLQTIREAVDWLVQDGQLAVE